MASSTGTLNRTGAIATWGHNPKEASPAATCQSRNGYPSSTGYKSSTTTDYRK